MNPYAETVLPSLRELPPALAALLLQQAERYEVLFPREQRELNETFVRLRPPRSPAAEQALAGFRKLRVPTELHLPNWEAEPATYAEAFTAAMWSSGQINAFRAAAQQVLPVESADQSKVSRVIVIVFDSQLRSAEGAPQLFRRLRPAGTLYTLVKAANSTPPLQEWMRARVLLSQEPYAHWLISGGLSAAWSLPKPVVKVAYGDLRPARLQLLQKMNQARYEGRSGGPEGLRSTMLAMHGRDMGMHGGDDPVLHAFAADVLTGGSGTQLYSTTFVQWTLREMLRRARPRTVLAHFTQRNASASMDVRLSNPQAEPPLDPAGSLIDAEMHTYMTYMNLLRLPAAQPASFLVWHPGYRQALLIGPGSSAASTVADETDLSHLLPGLS